MNIAILGWTSWFGKWIAERLLELQTNRWYRLNITVTWTNQSKWEKVASALGINFTTSNIEVVQNADITIVSVPISKTLQIIDQVWPYLKPGSIFADVTSIKGPVYDKMVKYQGRALIVPTHPMFGPFVKSISWQVVILTPPPLTKQDKRYLWFKDFLKSMWAKVFELDPYQHDKIMSIIQWLTHFTLFVVAESLHRLWKKFFDNEKDILGILDNFTSPVYKILISLTGRYMSQNPYLYADIQLGSKLNNEVHKTFYEVAKDFNKILFGEKNKEKFVEILSQWREFFGQYAQKGQKYTDKLIYLTSLQIDKFKSNIGQKVKLQNIYTKKVLEDILLDIDIEKEKIKLSQNGTLDINEWVIL